MELKKVTQDKAVNICDNYDPSELASDLLEQSPELTPAQFVDQLKQKEAFADALQFIVYALPCREAIWLACLAVRKSFLQTPKATDSTALEITEKWVFDPSEDNHALLETAALGTKMKTAAGMAAAAANWSKMDSPDEQFCLSSDAAWASISLAFIYAPPEDTQQKNLFFLNKAIDIANGGSGG